jgi:flavin reductase (DIM6/NTAB) family NADH-FMN oxidoreductase RutF
MRYSLPKSPSPAIRGGELDPAHGNDAGVIELSRALERDEFCAIMASLVTGVAVVTALDEEGRPCGLTSTAVCSVSADPPLLLVCVDKGSRTLPALLGAKAFVVNLLKEGRAELGRGFASKEEEKFRDVHWCPAGNAAPLLCEDTLAHAECVTEREIDAGDHVILLGSVVGGRAPEPAEQPLAYFRRAYGGFAHDGETATDTL